MEPSERIIDVYLKTKLNAFTISNIKLQNNKEIDFIAIDVNGLKYHVESSISISSHFSKLTNIPLNQINDKANRRRSLEFFQKEKFYHPIVIKKLKEFNFINDNYKKIIVTWSVKDDSVIEAAAKMGVEIWFLKDLLNYIFQNISKIEQYVPDEERLFQLISRWLKEENLLKKNF